MKVIPGFIILLILGLTELQAQSSFTASGGDAASGAGSILGVKNGFQFSYYWSSTESYDNFAGFQYFDYGSTYFDYKSSTYYVRAVRRF